MPQVLHVELVEQTPAALQLRLWRDNPNSVFTRTLALPEIEDLVAMTEEDYYAPARPCLEDVGWALFRWLDGGERWLSAQIEAVANRTDVLVLAIASSSRLAHLPWEALHDGTEFLVHAPNPPVLPVRWRSARPVAHAPANRSLRALFMAASPRDVKPVLQFEREEHLLLEATRRWPVDLRVEESGCLAELGAMLHACGDGFFDLVHLSGHASHAADGTPVFLLEDEEGRCKCASTPEIGDAVPYRPPLVFLSGCHTGQRPRAGELRSMAEQLVECGFPAVLGWGRAVDDADAIAAECELYRELAAGVPLPLALVRVHARLRRSGRYDWHLLRLCCAGDPPGALVTPPLAPGRRRHVSRPAEAEFLDPLTRRVRVAARGEFRGRRRLLQDALRLLRQPEDGRAGLLIHGPPGCGKSSVAARLCDRLRGEFQRVVLIGRLDEPAFIGAWVPELPAPARNALADPADELRFRIQAALVAGSEAGLPAPLFVLDDFEQNQPAAADGDVALAGHAAGVLGALLDAVRHTGIGAVLVTGRSPLPEPFAGFLSPAELPPLHSGGW